MRAPGVCCIILCKSSVVVPCRFNTTNLFPNLSLMLSLCFHLPFIRSTKASAPKQNENSTSGSVCRKYSSKSAVPSLKVCLSSSHLQHNGVKTMTTKPLVKLTAALLRDSKLASLHLTHRLLEFRQKPTCTCLVDDRTTRGDLASPISSKSLAVLFVTIDSFKELNLPCTCGDKRESCGFRQIRAAAIEHAQSQRDLLRL